MTTAAGWWISSSWRCSAMHSMKNKKDGGSSRQNRAKKGWLALCLGGSERPYSKFFRACKCYFGEIFERREVVPPTENKQPRAGGISEVHQNLYATATLKTQGSISTSTSWVVPRSVVNSAVVLISMYQTAALTYQFSATFTSTPA